MKKIMIIGCGGSGKSTLARKIHHITGLPLIHMDQYFWNAGWVDTERLEWIKWVERQSNEPEWIMDGNYGGTMDIRLKKADTVIFMDFSRWLCLFRIIKRQFKYLGRSRPDMAEGCIERLTWEFITYVYRYNKTRRPGILEKLQSYSKTKNVIILDGQKKIKLCLEEIKKKTTS